MIIAILFVSLYRLCCICVPFDKMPHVRASSGFCSFRSAETRNSIKYGSIGKCQNTQPNGGRARYAMTLVGNVE